MRWYWWLLLGLVVGAGAVFIVPLLLKSDKSDSLEKARAAKAAKANETKADEPASPDTV